MSVGNFESTSGKYYIVNNATTESYISLDNASSADGRINIFNSSWDWKLYSPVSISSSSPSYLPYQWSDESVLFTYSMWWNGDSELWLDWANPAEVFVEIDTILWQSASNFEWRALLYISFPMTL